VLDKPEGNTMGILSATQSYSLSSLQRTNDMIGLSQKRLAAGKSIFSAADDASKFKLSEGLLQRSAALTSVNDGITLALKALNAANTSLTNMTTSVTNMQKIARQAQVDVSNGSKSFTNTTLTAATNFTASGATDVKQRQIVIDTGVPGKSFTYNIPQSGDLTVGAFVNALNGANVGVTASFNASGTGLTFTSTSGGDINFAGSSDQTAMAQILVGATVGGVAVTAANAAAFANAAFSDQATLAASNNSNRTVTLATSITATDVLTAASNITFSAPDGTTRTVALAANSTVQTFMNSVNQLNIGVTASLVANAAGVMTLQLNNTGNTDIAISGVSGAISAAAARTVGTPSTVTLGLANGTLARNIQVPSATETGATIGFGARMAIGPAGILENDKFIAGGTLSFTGSDGLAQTVTLAAGASVKDLMSAINSKNSGIVAEIKQVPGGTTSLQLRNVNGGAVNVTAATGSFNTASARVAGTTTVAPSVTLGIPVNGTSQSAPPLSVPSAIRNEYVAKMTKYRADIDRYATEAGLPGGRNILSNQNLTVVLSEGTAAAPDSLVITGNPITATALGVTATFTFADDAAINTDLANLQTALNRLRDEQTRLGSNENYIKSRFDINKQTASSLKTDGESLVAVDQEEESAMLTALNTRSSFAVQSYSLANQAMQGLLQLLR
jgi:flagellin-like hook-associated protein FlgL